VNQVKAGLVVHRHQSVLAAARSIGCGDSAIFRAIQEARPFKGYMWQHADCDNGGKDCRRAREVDQMWEGVVILRHKSTAAAATSVGSGSKTAIWRAINTGRECQGYYWQYADSNGEGREGEEGGGGEEGVGARSSYAHTSRPEQKVALKKHIKKIISREVEQVWENQVIHRHSSLITAAQSVGAGSKTVIWRAINTNRKCKGFYWQWAAYASGNGTHHNSKAKRKLSLADELSSSQSACDSADEGTREDIGDDEEISCMQKSKKKKFSSSSAKTALAQHKQQHNVRQMEDVEDEEEIISRCPKCRKGFTVGSQRSGWRTKHLKRCCPELLPLAFHQETHTIDTQTRQDKRENLHETRFLQRFEQLKGFFQVYLFATSPHTHKHTLLHVPI
jgi:hypothetical protein